MGVTAGDQWMEALCMSRYFTHYWTNATWERERARGDEATLMKGFYGNQFTNRDMRTGDIVYAVTVLGGDLFVLCRVAVERVEPRSDLEGRWRERVVVREGTATPRRFASRVPVDVLKQLRFVSGPETAQLHLTDDAKLDHMAMRMMRELTPESAALLDNVIESYEAGLQRQMPSSVQRHQSSQLDANDTVGLGEQSVAGTPMWMFQYSPRYFNLERTLTKRQVEDWTAFWQRSAIQRGQTAYIFRSGKRAGIVAVGHLATGLYERPSKDRYMRYWVDIAFDALVDPPLTRVQDILADPLLREYDPYAKGLFRANVLLPADVAARTAALVRDRLRPITSYQGPVEDDDDLARQAAQTDEVLGDFDPASILDGRRRTVSAIVRRAGQPAFRRTLLEAYGGRCAITGSDAGETLEAAHITPYRGLETNHPANGLLLRADLHILFDLGLVSIDTTTMTVLVSDRLIGTVYAALAGASLRLPVDMRYRPSTAALEQHRAWTRL